MVWTATPIQNGEEPALALDYISKDGEEGYPGTLTVQAVYTLTKDNALQLEFTATTSEPTVVNLTHHSYFNLAGKGDILGHEVMINASRFTPVDSTLIPTGELRPVKGTPFDFTTPTAIGARINQDDEQLKFGKGYDHNWVDRQAGGTAGADGARLRAAERARAGGALHRAGSAVLHAAISSTARSRARAAGCISSGTRSAWSRSTTRTRPTSRRSLPRC